MASFLKKMIQGGAKVAEVAAPIVGGALGGPAGAAAGQALSGGIKKVASQRALGGSGASGPGQFVPSSAGSVEEARTQDRARMKRQYGSMDTSIE
jgi:hypothetical protein